MTKSDSKAALDTILAHVSEGRREFLQKVLAGSAAIPLLTSAVLTSTEAMAAPKKDGGKNKKKGNRKKEDTPKKDGGK